MSLLAMLAFVGSQNSSSEINPPRLVVITLMMVMGL